MSDCSCIYADYDGCADEIQKAVRVARKPHKCQECYRVIKKGEKYEYYAGNYDGFFTHKTCTDCLSVREEFFCSGFGFGAIWEDVWEHVQELDGNISSECLAKLTPRAREKICDYVQEAWDEEIDECEEGGCVCGLCL